MLLRLALSLGVLGSLLSLGEGQVSRLRLRSDPVRPPIRRNNIVLPPARSQSIRQRPRSSLRTRSSPSSSSVSYRRKPLNVLGGQPSHPANRVLRRDRNDKKEDRRQSRTKFSRGGERETKYRLKVQDTTVTQCPERWTSELGEIKANVSQGRFKAKHGGTLQSLRLTRDGGVMESILLPSCFDMEATFTFDTQIRDPYAEAFISVGGKALCEGFKPNDYCAQSQHPALARLQGRANCRFCDMCSGAAVVGRELRKMGTVAEGPVRECPKYGAAIRAGQRYPFLLKGLCTPSTEDINRSLEKELGVGWRELAAYARRGNIQIQLHLMDRRNSAPRPCLQLGAGVYKHKGPASQSRAMERSLRQMCRRWDHRYPQREAPEDRFISCSMISINYNLEEVPANG